MVGAGRKEAGKCLLAKPRARKMPKRKGEKARASEKGKEHAPTDNPPVATLPRHALSHQSARAEEGKGIQVRKKTDMEKGRQNMSMV